MRFYQVAIVGWLQIVATAQSQTPPHRDVSLYLEQGLLKTGAFDFDNGNIFLPNIRAYRGWFGEVANGTNDPGFTAPAATFAQGTLVSFNILDALRKWDGSDFDSIPAERLFVSLGASNRQTPTTADTFVTGFNITQVGADGGVHQHINFFLTTPFSTGVYLLKFEARVTSVASASLPIYFVFNQIASVSDHEAAFAYVQDVILAPPPCLGDANGDRSVNFPDITAVLANWATTGAPGIPGDADRDGTVAFPDITSVLGNWGTSCP